MNVGRERKNIELEYEIKTYLSKLKYAIESSGTRIAFQKTRRVDENRDKKYTNRYTISQLFPDEDAVEAIKRELAQLRVEEYVKTVEDIRFPNKSDMRVFGKKYLGEYVYIKIRVELVNSTYAAGGSYILVMSFHFAEREFQESDFPYRKKRGEIN